MTDFGNRWVSPSSQFAADNSVGAASDLPIPFSFQADTDTGMFRVAANTLGFAAGGTEVFRATSTAVSFSAYIARSVANTLTAVGTDRASSLALTAQVNNVTTAASGTGVTLPAVSTAGIGTTVFVFNGGANVIKVYGSGSDTIDATAGSTGVSLTNAKRCAYVAVAAATWISAQLGVVSA